MAELAKTTQVAQRHRSDQRNRNALRALVLPVQKRDVPDPVAKADTEPGASKSVTEDPWFQIGELDIIEPPFDMLTLAMLPEQNTELTPVLETMAANIEGFGYHLQSRVDLKKIDDPAERARMEREIHREKIRLTNFFNYANLDDSFTMLRKKKRVDTESTGNAYWEVIRNAKGEIQGFEHLPAYQVRITPIEEHPIKVRVPTLQLQEDGSFAVEQIEAWQRFRRFVQARVTPYRGLASQVGYKRRWFKAFGDPRVYDNTTGEIIPAERVANFDGKGSPMPEFRRANEVIHFKLYSPRSLYGLPRFIGNLLSIFGARAAEEINYVTFRNHNIPSMVVLVSNGQLTEGSIARIESFIESKIQGSDNFSKFLIIEAEGLVEGEDGGHIKIDIKPLTSEQIKDALFQQYTKNNQDNVRRAYRLPPIFVGKSDDYTRATAEASRKLADEQVFAPERDDFDDFINRLLFPAMGVVFHRFKSNSPNTTDNTELVKILSGAEKTGGVTPRIARMILEDILGRDLPDFPEDDERFNADLPFSLLMAEAVKNKGDPSEPGQQVTALKRLEALGLWNEGEPEPTIEEVVVQHVGKLRKLLEREWESRVSEHEHDEGL